MSKVSQCPDALRFIKAWMAHPRSVGAVWPSSRYLADLITREISPLNGPILELGVGTGAFTRALLSRGIAENRLTLIECDPQLASDLREAFPRAVVHCSDASRLKPHSLPLSGTIVSGLPLLSMSTKTVMGMLNSAFSSCSAGAALYQFTYLPRCPVPKAVLERLGLKAAKVGSTFLNFPPASVYRITRRRHRHVIAGAESSAQPHHLVKTDTPI